MNGTQTPSLCSYKEGFLDAIHIKIDATCMKILGRSQPLPKLRSYFWSDEELLKNLGDALAPLVLAGMGYQYARYYKHDNEVANPGRCIFAIGSMIEDAFFDLVKYPVDIWGCGWQGGQFSEANSDRATFHAVRGPVSAKKLGLPADIPMGDPALLLPRFFPRKFKQHGKRVLVPHFRTVFEKTRKDWLVQTGCDDVVSMQVIGSPKEWVNKGFPIAKKVIEIQSKTKISIYGVMKTICSIAGASFVLSASLHGAILAQAFGVPWALFNDGYAPSCLVKYEDWTDFLHLNLDFASNIQEAEKWWNESGKNQKMPTLKPLLHSFPYTVTSSLAVS